MTDTNPIWTPSPQRVDGAGLTRFREWLREEHGLEFADYQALWQWSVDEMERFWVLWWDWAGVIAKTRGERVLVNGDSMPTARFFPDARLNFAENLLQGGQNRIEQGREDTPALIFRNEVGDRRETSWQDLQRQVATMATAMKAQGVAPGDRVAVWMPALPETIVIALAAAAIGATFSSCSTDYGVTGVLDRFGQVQPAVLFVADGHHYNGKVHSTLDRLAEVQTGLPTLRQTVLVPYLNPGLTAEGSDNTVTLAEYTAGHDASDVPYAHLPFNHPLFILFSSGTTGAPKCIVHSAGGSLVQQLKEDCLHHDVRAGDRILFFTSTSWVVWNMHLSFLASGATLLIYEGSPLYPDLTTAFRYIEGEQATYFGTCAKFIDSLRAQDLPIGEQFDLSNLRTLVTSGSPLVEEAFDYVYRRIKPDIHLASVSGGTDIMCGFTVCDATAPVWRGEMQCNALAMAVAVWDDDGNPMPTGEAGELVCTKPFPSLPLGFLNDPDGSRYYAAYYDHYSGIWRHGDHMKLTETGGSYIYGRSDATLNPGGIRIGTAEIYRQIEMLDDVIEGVAIGQQWEDDTRVVLFVCLVDGVTLSADLEARIRKQIRDNTSPRHVPARIVQVPDIPRTLTGKIVELAVRDVVHARPVKNKDALANPEALDHFAGRAELA